MCLLCQLPQLSDKVSSESRHKDVNTALNTVPIESITETNRLIYTKATVIFDMLGYTMNSNHNKQDPQLRRRLEAKIKATQREFSQLSELQKGVSKKGVPKKNNTMSIADSLENAKQQLSALTSDLKRYTRSINRMFSY